MSLDKLLVVLRLSMIHYSKHYQYKCVCANGNYKFVLCDFPLRISLYRKVKVKVRLRFKVCEEVFFGCT